MVIIRYTTQEILKSFSLFSFCKIQEAFHYDDDDDDDDDDNNNNNNKGR